MGTNCQQWAVLRVSLRNNKTTPVVKKSEIQARIMMWKICYNKPQLAKGNFVLF